MAAEGSRRYRLVTVAGGVLGCGIACMVPYAPFLNVLYGLNGHLGFALMAFMMVHDVKGFAKARKGER